MQKKDVRIELIRVIKFEVPEDDLYRIFCSLVESKKEQIAWLEENNYNYEIYVEHQGGGKRKNTEWPELEHAILFLELSKDAAIHYKIVWE